ncbi:MAG: hypothetical protein NXI04_21050 [Planctomycetaceae bacterium]|nr:hypothetical protein [Planctomycetaceae bacterium]
MSIPRADDHDTAGVYAQFREGLGMNIDILTFDAASGHKSAAEAVRLQLQTQMPQADIRIVDLGDVLKCQTRLLGWIYQNGISYFNWCMRNERYFLFPASIRAWILFARINTRVAPLECLLQWTARFWSDRTPDVIVSVTPMKHTIVFEAARTINPNVCCITIPVDYSEMTSGYWFQPKVRQHYLLGGEQLHREARAAGVEEARIHRMGGMVIDPRFYENSPFDRRELLSSLGLHPDLPTGVISFGSQGTVNVLRCARRIAAAQIPVNLICLTGRNAQLAAQVGQLATPYPVIAQPFQAAPPVLAHRLADFLIGKPGTMTLNEALVTRTPFIFVKSRGLDLLQRGNEDWVLEKGVGVQADTPDTVDEAVNAVLQDPQIHQNIRAVQHRGVFEAGAVIARLIDGDLAASRLTPAAPLSKAG